MASFALYKTSHPRFMTSSHNFLTSHPLYLTLYPLYLCHNIHCIDDMKPTEFLRSHLLYMMTSYPFYTTSKPLNVCYHTHCIDNIKPILCMTSHSPYVWHRLHYKRHHILTLCPQTTVFMSSNPLYWHRVHCICVLISSTVLMISHQLCFWDHMRYNTRHHIHCIRHVSHCMTSQPLHSWHQIPYIWRHLQGLWHLVPYTCEITDTMFVNTCQVYLTSNTRC